MNITIKGNSVKARMAARIKSTPRRFQIRGVRFLERCLAGRGGILGDDMGLGKTFQAIAALALNPHLRPAVIACPATLKYNWQKEFWAHARMEAEVAEGTRPGAGLDGDVWILNYDILEKWLPWLLERKPRVLILDECQRVKNRGAKRTRATVKLAKRAKRVLALSGTPIENGPVEFFPVLNMVAPDVFPSFVDYAFKFCAPKRGFRGHWNFGGASNLPELRERIAPFFLRRTKREVLPDLPAKTRTVLPVRVDMREYNRAKKDFLQYIGEAKGPDAVRRARRAAGMVKIEELRRLAARAKMKTVLEWIRDFRADNPGRKLVVFGVHRSVIGELHAAYPDAAVVTGAVTGVARQRAVDRFQTDPKCGIFLGNLAAAAEGITLTAASTTLTIELLWNPAKHDQAEDRVHRIGQTAGHVDAYYLIAKGTIEEYLWDVVESKRGVVGRVLDGDGAVDAIQTRVIEKLLNERTM